MKAKLALAACIVGILAIVGLVAVVLRQKDQLERYEHQLKPIPSQEAVIAKAVALAAADQGIKPEALGTVFDHFLVELKDRSCVYFTPTKGVKGGAAWYCLSNQPGHALLSKELVGQ